jgi:hypothetical protein
MLASALWRLWTIVRGVYLDITLVNDKHERVDVLEGDSVDDTLDAFLNQTGRFANGWVPIRKGEAYVRYDQIVSVRPVEA